MELVTGLHQGLSWPTLLKGTNGVDEAKLAIIFHFLVVLDVILVKRA